jgi:Dolichyl-phosphate-mannose-protein mannosyltransferase
MIGNSLNRVVNGRIVVPFSVATSFLLGLVFIFIWAPHPWGWLGIDQYHQLATELSKGRPFSTMDVPWGYAYFLALFYRLFGPSPIPPLIAQAALNASLPALVYRYGREAFDSRVAAIAALLTGVLSFNTVYASTESSDSVCTVLFVGAVVLFASACRRGDWRRFAAAGALCGLAAQFRPNLILVPLVLALFAVGTGVRDSRRFRNSTITVAFAGAMLVPWVVRNYELTGQFIPTSTHGGVQLWYGTLQTGLYLDARQQNPRRVFEAPVFPYSSLMGAPVIVEGKPSCDLGRPASVDVVYWTDADPTPTRVPLERTADARYAGAIPAPFHPRTISYYFDITWATSLPTLTERYSPAAGPAEPLVYFLSDQHLSDIDSTDAVLDIFDLSRLLQHIAWGVPIRAAEKLDSDRNGRLDESDFRAAVGTLLSGVTQFGKGSQATLNVTASSTDVRARFVDGSELVVPKRWSGLVTDLQVGDGIAAALLRSSPFSEARPSPELLGLPCLGIIDVGINRPFYRTQPHEMRRYTALAWDNIRRDPRAYASSVLYRAVRLFVIRGTDDRGTAVQFAGSRRVYAAATAATAIYLVLFLLGAVLAWHRGYAVWLPLVLVAYVPATIAFVLTNMRYTVSVQPFMFLFIAVALVAVLERFGALSPAVRDEPAARHLEENGTTSRL